MTKFIARQPIFDRRKNIYGYELLFRSGMANFFSGLDLTGASYSVLADSMLLHSLEALTDNRKAFFNCTQEVLSSEYIGLLPKQVAVLEILETVAPDPEVLDACRRLKNLGFRLALDDVSSGERPQPFQDVVDIIKVDFHLCPPEARKEIVREFSPYGISMLAEKVETYEDLRQAEECGFHYFQGFFFSKPEILSRNDIPSFKLNYLRLLQAIHQPEVEVAEIESIIKTEPSLCYKLLRYLNSPLFGFRSQIHSIPHAVSLLGLREIKTWVSLVALAAMSKDKPEELVLASLIRARLCESLAGRLGMKDREGDLFLLGLFSMIDAILDRPLPEILSQLPLEDDIKNSLACRNTRLGQVLDLAQAYERGEWDNVTGRASALKLDESGVPELYLQAVGWTQQIFQLA